MGVAGKAAAVAAGAMLCVAFAHAAPFDAVRPSAEASRVAHWVLDSGDNAGRAYAIVDKKQARLFVFDASGRLAGDTAVLLGAARGDDSAPGIGTRAPQDLLPHEKTTPAGRFETQPGRNLSGEHVVWVEYDSGFAIHRLRPGLAREARQRRLASAGADDNRASLGCVVVPVAFYEAVIEPLLGRDRAVVYVLPETRPLDTLFGPPG